MTFYDVSRCVIMCDDVLMMFWWCLSSNFWVCLMMFDNFWLLPKEGDPNGARMLWWLQYVPPRAEELKGPLSRVPVDPVKALSNSWSPTSWVASAMFSQEWGVEYLKMDGWGPLRHKRVQWFIIFPIAALVIAPYTLGKRLLLHIGQGARQIHPWEDAAPMGNPVPGHSKQGSGRAKSFIHVKHVKHQGNPRPESQPGDGYSIPLKDHVQVQSSRHPQSNLQES